MKNQLITEQVREIAHNVLLSQVLRDPRELSVLLAAELDRLDIIGFDESAEPINFAFYEGFTLISPRASGGSSLELWIPSA